jgi:hypothetical protein
MVFDSANLVSQAQSAGSGALSIIWYIVLGLVVIIMLTIIGVVWYFKKRWNLQVEFKLVRNDGRIIQAEWGKGYFDARKGVVYVRRPTMGKFRKGVPIKIFDIRKYIQGLDIITVLQVGPEDYRPVLNDSWTEYVTTAQDDNTGEIVEVKEAVINIKVDSGADKAWKSSWDVSAKKAYSIQSLLAQFQTPIAIGIVIICCFVGFAILWTKIPGAG